MAGAVAWIRNLLASSEPEPPAQGSYQRPAATLDRKARIESEILMVAPHIGKHGGIHYDENDGDWLMVPKYPLPARWRCRWCKLLILFPETYPLAAPIGFYLDRKFQLKIGGADPHLTGTAYHGATDLLAQGWYWYCVRLLDACQGGWRPSRDYRQPDNLWSFFSSIRETLTND